MQRITLCRALGKAPVDRRSPGIPDMKRVTRKSRIWDLFLLISIVVTVIACVWPGMRAPLFSDDVFQVGWVREYRGWTEVFKPDVFGFYRPVKNALFLLLLPISGNLMVWHGVGLAAYLAAMLGVARIAEICLGSRRLALLAAAVWALSPTCVSTAVWLSCANISLGLACAAGAFHFHEWTQTRGQQRWLIGAFACYLLSLLCYETFIVVPALLFLRDFQQQRLAPVRSAGVRYGLYLVSAVAFLLVRHEFSAKGVASGTFHTGFAPDTTNIRLMLSAPWFFWRHFLMWIMPVGNIELFGSYAWMRSVSLVGLVSSWLFFSGWFAVAAALWKRLPAASFGMLVFFIANVPSGNFLPCFNGPINDAYVTIPSVGLAIAFACTCGWLWAGWLRHRAKGVGIAMMAVLVVLVFYRLPACAAYFGYWAGIWRDSTKMVLLMTESRPYQFQLKGIAAVKLLSSGYLAPAEDLANETLREAPWNHSAKMALARIAVYRKDTATAERFYRSVLGSSGTYSVEILIINDARLELANLLVASPDRLEEAANLCRLILVSGSKEKRIPAALLLARIYANQGLRDKARATLLRGLQLYLGNAEMTAMLADIEGGKPIPLDTTRKSGHPAPPDP